MKEPAIAAACDRLERVQEALRVFEAGVKTISGTRTAWANFLVAANGVYSKLEQGSKGHGPSEAWYARKNQERKTDETLRYIHQARNAEEHSIEGSDSAHGP